MFYIVLRWGWIFQWNALSTIEKVAIKLGTDNHVHLRIDSNGSGDSLLFNISVKFNSFNFVLLICQIFCFVTEFLQIQLNPAGV